VERRVLRCQSLRYLLTYSDRMYRIYANSQNPVHPVNPVKMLYLSSYSLRFVSAVSATGIFVIDCFPTHVV